MLRVMLKSKIHRATVTDANLHYVGSITLDPELLEAADIAEYEKVAIWNVTNGERLETYTILGERGKGECCLNGAAARKVAVGDVVIIASYGMMDSAEAAEHEPTVVLVDEQNAITSIDHEEVATTSRLRVVD